MSRKSDAKKARRRKRQAARDASWIPGPVFDDIAGLDSELDEIGEAIGVVDEWITGRGWELDTDSATTQMVSWVYPPSVGEFDGDREPVTRIWIALDEDDDEVVLEFGAVLAGFGSVDEPYLLDPETLAEAIGALEAYRPGLPMPVLN